MSEMEKMIPCAEDAVEAVKQKIREGVMLHFADEDDMFSFMYVMSRVICGQEATGSLNVTASNRWCCEDHEIISREMTNSLMEKNMQEFVEQMKDVTTSSRISNVSVALRLRNGGEIRYFTASKFEENLIRAAGADPRLTLTGIYLPPAEKDDLIVWTQRIVDCARAALQVQSAILAQQAKQEQAEEEEDETSFDFPFPVSEKMICLFEALEEVSVYDMAAVLCPSLLENEADKKISEEVREKCSQAIKLAAEAGCEQSLRQVVICFTAQDIAVMGSERNSSLAIQTMRCEDATFSLMLSASNQFDENEKKMDMRGAFRPLLNMMSSVCVDSSVLTASLLRQGVYLDYEVPNKNGLVDTVTVLVASDGELSLEDEADVSLDFPVKEEVIRLFDSFKDVDVQDLAAVMSPRRFALHLEKMEAEVRNRCEKVLACAKDAECFDQLQEFVMELTSGMTSKEMSSAIQRMVYEDVELSLCLSVAGCCMECGEGEDSCGGFLYPLFVMNNQYHAASVPLDGFSVRRGIHLGFSSACLDGSETDYDIFVAEESVVARKEEKKNG